jgi:hypothetical protein
MFRARACTVIVVVVVVALVAGARCTCRCSGRIENGGALQQFAFDLPASSFSTGDDH